MAQKKLIQAISDGKGLGNGINALAAEGKIRPVFAQVGDEMLGFNSTWALTDWKKERGYYGPDAQNLPVVRVVESAE